MKGTGGRCEAEGHCITCSDEGIAMRVVEIVLESELALCVDDRGRESEVLTGLVDRVRCGETLLVHAGTALARLAGEEAAGR